MTAEHAPTTGEIRARLLEQVAAYLLEHRGVEDAAIDDATRFREDLDLDSLDLAALALRWEQEHEIVVEDERVVVVETVGEAVELLRELAGAR